ncbi:hypothetical protein B0H19DRAFT_1055115 [Mycena capillaripes]|nr:hypothetical protein B0H19DRAFT_1055115 [Mycena capillaripes]
MSLCEQSPFADKLQTNCIPFDFEIERIRSFLVEPLHELAWLDAQVDEMEATEVQTRHLDIIGVLQIQALELLTYPPDRPGPISAFHGIVEAWLKRKSYAIRWVDCHDKVPEPLIPALNLTDTTFNGTLPSNLLCGEMDVPTDYNKPFNADPNNATFSGAFSPYCTRLIFFTVMPAVQGKMPPQRHSTPAGIMQHVGTIEVIRDWDAVRAPLGYEKVNCVGVSGTFVGIAYAGRYPHRVDRLPTELTTFAWEHAPKSTLVIRHGDDHVSILANHVLEYSPSSRCCNRNVTRKFLLTGVMPGACNNVAVTVIPPGRGLISSAYDVPTGTVAGDTSTIENVV